MSIETEVKEAAENEAKKIETAVEGVGDKIETKAKDLRVEVTTEENLFLRNVEAQFLRAQIEIRDKQRELEATFKKSEVATKTYAEKIEALIAKYGIDKATQRWDNVENVFKPTQPA